MSGTFIEGGTHSSRVREATIHWGREEATICQEIGGTVHWGREGLFIKGGRNHSSREGGTHSSREEATLHWGLEELFVKGGRQLFIEGQRNRLSREGGTIHHGRRRLFIKDWRNHSLREGGTRSLRERACEEATVHWAMRVPFIKGGGRWLFVEIWESLREEVTIRWGREASVHQGWDKPVHWGREDPFFVEGRRQSFIERGGHLSRMGGGCWLRMGGGCSSSKGGEGGLCQLDVVERKNNEFPHWEIWNSTWSHDVRVSMDLEWIVAHELQVTELYQIHEQQQWLNPIPLTFCMPTS